MTGEWLQAPVTDARPLVVHVLHRFDTGGLENGVVNLLNHMPESTYRHVVVALTDMSSFRSRVSRTDVGMYALHKPPGQGFWSWPAMWRLLRGLQPAIVHTRNLGPLEMQAAAWAARVPVRLHGEHGREISDVDGSNLTMQRLRRLYARFVHRQIALSQDLERYLVDRVGLPSARVVQIYNGVDEQRFRPTPDGVPTELAGSPFHAPRHWLVGTVGRMQTVKNQTLLVRAFVRALELRPEMKTDARLVMIGDGPLLAECAALLGAAGAQDMAWLPGERSDVPDVMRALNCFVLPSMAEGISNTILEAMACGLPVVATRVGGNDELVVDGETGCIVPAGDVETMAWALAQAHADREAQARRGRAGRTRIERQFGIQAMVAAYRALYDTELAARCRTN